MIDWNKSAELNKVSIKELKAYFHRFPGTRKQVASVCGKCGKKGIHRLRDTRDICGACNSRNKAAAMSKDKIGTKHSEESIAKMRKSHKGNKSNTGRKLSPEHCENLSKAGKGKKRPPRTAEHCENISIAKKGKKMSDEARANMSKARKGVPTGPYTDEHRQRMSAGQQGIPYDEWESFAKEQLYCPRFNEACRESNRAKYGYRCFICNKPQSENITKTGKVRKLSVHHVDMDKAQGCESNWKLVPLCLRCHATAHNDEIIARLGYMVKDS